MKKLQVSMTYWQMTELKEHLWLNGYHFEIYDDIIEIDENEFQYLKTILYDRGIGWIELD